MTEGKYRTVIFDLDGTLLDTLDDLTASVNAALAKHGLPLRSKDEVCRFVGNGVLRLMERAVPEGYNHPDFERIYQDFREDYGRHCNEKTKPYPGILKLLERLKRKGYGLAIVSNKADFAVNTLREIDFDGLIDVAIGERETIRKKPAPDTVLAALKRLGADAGTAVYVGDSEVDLETAANVPMDEIAVTWGFRDAALLKERGADRMASSVEELERML